MIEEEDYLAMITFNLKFSREGEENETDRTVFPFNQRLSSYQNFSEFLETRKMLT